MIVCLCRRVSDREIARHVRAGLGFDEIQIELGVATQCGQCESCAREVVAQCNAASPVANIVLAYARKAGGQFEWKPDFRAHYSKFNLFRSSMNYSGAALGIDYLNTF